jgi:hypothetical protein
LESQEEETRQRIIDLLKEAELLREQLRVARLEYRTRFQELSARLLLQTRTWRSLRIRRRKLASELVSLQRTCNELMEEFLKIETIRIQEQQELMRLLGAVPPSERVSQAKSLKRVNEFYLEELSEGLSLRWKVIDQIEIGVENVEHFVRAHSKGRE